MQGSSIVQYTATKHGSQKKANMRPAFVQPNMLCQDSTVNHGAPNALSNATSGHGASYNGAIA